MSLTIGQQLKSARLDRNLSYEDVFKNIHLRIKYLEALEADDYSVMPSPVQGRGFLRLYAQFLEVDIDAILEDIQRKQVEEGAFAKVENRDDDVTAHTEALLDAPIAGAETETKTPLWTQLLARIGGTHASPKPAPAQETESAPIAEASPTSAREPYFVFPDPDRVHRPTLPPAPRPRTEFEIPAVVYDYVQPAPTPKLEESHLLFAKIGATLRERREMLSLTYEEIEGHVHLRPHYLAALEAGDFEALPSPVQTRGMLSNYADFLDLDSEELLLQFAEGLQSQRIERRLSAPDDAGKRKRRKFPLGGFIAPDLIFGGSVVVLMIAFAVWGLGRIAASRAADLVLEATAPSIAEVLMSTATPEVTQEVTPTLIVVNTPGGEVGTPVPLDENLPEDANLGVQILVTVLERSWIRVHVDGELVFEGRAQANATFVYEGNTSVEVLTANGAGVRIGYNQRDMGLMGGFGEVVQRLYGARGILTPTVTPTSEVVSTPTQTSTLTPSPTSTPTATSTAIE